MNTTEQAWKAAGTITPPPVICRFNYLGMKQIISKELFVQIKLRVVLINVRGRIIGSVIENNCFQKPAPST